MALGTVVRSEYLPDIPDGNFPWELWGQETDERTPSDSIVRFMRQTLGIGYFLINNSLGVTGEHPIYVKRINKYQFIIAKELIIGDYLVKQDKSLEMINSIEWQLPDYNNMLYVLDVEEVDTYYANGILVHNKS